MKIKVLSRQSMEEFKSDENHIVISISDPNSEKVKIISKPIDILSLQFHDMDKILVKRKNCKICDGTGKSKIFNNERCYNCIDMDITFFNELNAEKILDFVSTYALDIDLIVIHCEAGISRSAGVAGALALIYNKEDQYYFDNYLPNMLVYRKIIKVALNKGFLNDY